MNTKVQNDVDQQVIKLVAEGLRLNKDLVQPESHIYDELGADSLDAVELVMALESEFEIEISDDDAEACNTVADLIKLVKDAQTAA